MIYNFSFLLTILIFVHFIFYFLYYFKTPVVIKLISFAIYFKLQGLKFYCFAMSKFQVVDWAQYTVLAIILQITHSVNFDFKFQSSLSNWSSLSRWSPYLEVNLHKRLGQERYLKQYRRKHLWNDIPPRWLLQSKCEAGKKCWKVPPIICQ